MEALAKYHDQPILYLMDLVNVDIPQNYSVPRKKFKELLEGCRALRCPNCNEDPSVCLPIEL